MSNYPPDSDPHFTDESEYEHEDEQAERDERLIALCNEHAQAESPAYAFGCTLLGAAERAGFIPDGREISDRNKQCEQFIGAAIEQFTSAQQRGSELQREVDAGIADIDLAALLDDLESARDYLSRGPWEASEAAKERFKVRIANDAYECPEGSAQVRTTIDGDIPSKCLIPYGVIHYSDAEGIVLMRNRLEEMIRVVESATRAAKQQ